VFLFLGLLLVLEEASIADELVRLFQFVHKLYSMVVDPNYQHLISWTASGSSFVVANVLEFSREVLPKRGLVAVFAIIFC